MKERFIINSWLIVISWCLLLNGSALLACLLALVSSIDLLMYKSEVDIWRVSAVTLGFYIGSLSILLYGNISYFFPKLTYFVPIVCLHAAITNEYLYMLKKRFVLPLTIFISLSIAVLSIIIVVVPDELYSLFSKTSLFMMEFLIFLPYLIPCVVCLIYKARYNKHKISTKQSNPEIINI